MLPWDQALIELGAFMRARLLYALVAGGLWLAGCGPTPQTTTGTAGVLCPDADRCPCSNDADCPDGWSCSAGVYKVQVLKSWKERPAQICWRAGEGIGLP